MKNNGRNVCKTNVCSLFIFSIFGLIVNCNCKSSNLSLIMSHFYEFCEVTKRTAGIASTVKKVKNRASRRLSITRTQLSAPRGKRNITPRHRHNSKRAHNWLNESTTMPHSVTPST